MALAKRWTGNGFEIVLAASSGRGVGSGWQDVTTGRPGQGEAPDLFRKSVMFPLWRTRPKSAAPARSIKVRRS